MNFCRRKGRRRLGLDWRPSSEAHSQLCDIRHIPSPLCASTQPHVDKAGPTFPPAVLGTLDASSSAPSGFSEMMHGDGIQLGLWGPRLLIPAAS